MLRYYGLAAHLTGPCTAPFWCCKTLPLIFIVLPFDWHASWKGTVKCCELLFCVSLGVAATSPREIRKSTSKSLVCVPWELLPEILLISSSAPANAFRKKGVCTLPGLWNVCERAKNTLPLFGFDLLLQMYSRRGAQSKSESWSWAIRHITVIVKCCTPGSRHSHPWWLFGPCWHGLLHFVPFIGYDFHNSKRISCFSLFVVVSRAFRIAPIRRSLSSSIDRKCVIYRDEVVHAVLHLELGTVLNLLGYARLFYRRRIPVKLILSLTNHFMTAKLWERQWKTGLTGTIHENWRFQLPVESSARVLPVPYFVFMRFIL